ncbi:hypothetical protein [uncultured Oceanisphaera sp.]|uniref:hypothetical protein n=1 Tax=uncultured Oceanisphaera sp. TaxID=353858 RepID=UPI00261C3DB2|nr:hypothetical protein [uncultured Oceanisphaera sp.]
MRKLKINSVSLLGVMLIILFSTNTYSAKTSTGDKASKNLGDLTCTLSQIPRYNGSDWDCDSGLSVIEEKNLDFRVSGLEGNVVNQGADIADNIIRIDTLENPPVVLRPGVNLAGTTFHLNNEDWNLRDPLILIT